MKLYDRIIRETTASVMEESPRVFAYDSSRCWKDRGESELIMMRDAAYDLGGGGLPSANFTCVTSSGLIERDEVILAGPDLTEIKSDVSYARVVFLETDDIGEDEEAYNAIKNLEFVRYHVFPAGYMVRVSSQSNQEQVRLSKRVLAHGISFSYVGNTYIRKYRAVPGVRHVRVLFVTDSDLVNALSETAGKVDAITKTLTHILEGLPTDCGHCDMKPVCDEVEGMRELHLGKKNRG